MATIFLGIGFIGLFFILMAVRLIFKKDEEFRGTCASQSPFLNKEGVKCGVCGKDPNLCESKSESNNEPMPTIV